MRDNVPVKRRTSTKAIAAALGGVAAAGAGADPADAMLPASDGGGAPPATTKGDGPAKSGHPTQGQTQAPPPPARKPTPPPAPVVNPTLNKPKVGPAGPDVPPSVNTPSRRDAPVRDVPRHEAPVRDVPRRQVRPDRDPAPSVVNPTANKPKVVPPGATEPQVQPQKTPVRTGHPTHGQVTTPKPDPVPATAQGPPEGQKQLHDDATRYAGAMDQIDANGGALNQGTANTLNEFGGRPRVRKLASQIRETRAERQD